MRKRIINQNAQNISASEQNWLDLQSLAQVELTSEQAGYPVEAAFMSDAGSGWRAAQAGEQTIRLLFDQLQNIKHIQLLFQEDQYARTQEFVLRWSRDGESYQDIVRQQYHFSPPNTTSELEDYTVELVGVSVLELKIIPDISGGDAQASIARLRIA
jgi:hypothetical protein